MVCKDCEALAKRVEELERIVKELEKKLAMYENANTPPSQRRFPPREKSSNNKPGRKEGHEGTTREFKQPDEQVEVKQNDCNYCNSQLGEPHFIETRIIEDIPKPQTSIVKQYKIAHYFCNNCKKEITAKHEDLPKEGSFGKNILAEASLLKYADRLPLRKTVLHLNRRYNLQLTASTALDLTRRVSDSLNEEYLKLIGQLRKAKKVHIDETSVKVNGKRYWIWIFVTEDVQLAVIRKSRGKKVLKEILGEPFNGIIISDGLKSYSNFTKNRQRCWAHLLREIKYLASEYKEAEDVYEQLKALFHKVKEKLALDPPETARKRLYYSTLSFLKMLLSKVYHEEKVKKFIEKANNDLRSFLTFILHKGIEPTNNAAERALREHVVIRKIIGTLRNAKGTKIHETLMSIIATCKLRNINPFSYIHSHL